MRCLTCRKWEPCIARDRFRHVLASFNGKTLNYCAIGRRLALSRTTAAAWIQAYNRAGLVHMVPPLGPTGRPLLLVSPRFRDEADSFAEAEVLEAVRRLIPESRFYCWRTGRVRRIPLIADTGTGRTGFCFSDTPGPQRWQWLPLLIALRRRLIDRAFLLNDGFATLKEEAVCVLPVSALLANLRALMFDQRTPFQTHREMGRINRERLARPFAPR